MNKEELKRTQPVAWKTLSQALKSGKLSHAYLFYGPKGSPKSAMALLLAQSVFCEHPDEDGFACQQCSSCKKVEQEDNLDFFWMHPGGIRQKKRLSRKELDAYWSGEGIEVDQKEVYRIKKDGILDLQEAFAKGAVLGDRQIYILEQYDTATPEASNSLLKFLEEPHEGLTGILTTQELGNVLPTIQSRCQLISFRPASAKMLEESLAEICEDPEARAMLAANGWHLEEARDIVTEDFDKLKSEALTYYENKARLDAAAMVQMGFFSEKDKVSKQNVQLFLQWLMFFAKKDTSLEAMQDLKIRTILLEGMDRLKRPVDLMLLMDRTMYQIWKVMNPFA